MNILLIGNKETSEDPEKYYGEYAAFFEAATRHSSKNAEIKFTLIDDLNITVGEGEFSIYDTRHRCEIDQYHLIIIRGKGFRLMLDAVKAISTYASLKGIPVVNNYKDFRDSSKLTQAVQFFENGLLVPKSIYATSAVLAQDSVSIGMPCIMKATLGSHGQDNYLIKDMAEAREIATKSQNKRFVLQRFIPNKNDYRLLIIGEEVLPIKRTASGGSHLNNTSQGGQAELVDDDELPPKTFEDSRKIMDYLGMTIAGVDVLVDENTGEIFFLEVNSQPQIMTGANVEDKAKAFGKFFDSLQG